MWGAYIRYGAYALFGALIAAVIEMLVQPLIDVLTPAADGTIVLQSLVIVRDHTLLIILLACALGVLYRAIIERETGPEVVR
jgi:hypothetical protein